MEYWREIEEEAAEAAELDTSRKFHTKIKELTEDYPEIVRYVLTGNQKIKYWIEGEQTPYISELN